MLKIIETNIPSATNQRLLSLLKTEAKWSFGHDKDIETDPSRDAGLTFNPYNEAGPAVDENGQLLDRTQIITAYGFFIYDMITSKLDQKFSSLYRMLYNIYFRGITEAKFHIDIESHNYWTFIYSLNSNDGGLEIKINDETKFIKSIESQAIVFPSTLYHRGVTPKTEAKRYSLAFVTKI